MFRADFLSEGSKNQRKILLCRFKQCFGAFNMFTAHKCFDTGLFKHLSNPAFCSLTFHKKMNSESHLFFQIIQNFMWIWEMQREIEKIFRFLDNCIWVGCVKDSLLHLERIHFIERPYVHKQSKDFRYC